MIYLLFFMCVAMNVCAMDSIAPKSQEVKKDAEIAVDRHILTMRDVRKDASILISGVRVTPKFVISAPVPISKEEVQREYLPQANPMADISTTVSTEDVGVTHYNYTDKGFYTN